MANAIAGYGTLLQVADSGGSVYTTVAEVNDIGGPKFASEVVDITNMTSPSAFREKLSVLNDPGELGFTVNLIPGDVTQGNVSGLLFLWRTRAKRNVKLVWPNAVEWTFLSAQVTGFEVKAAVDDRVTADVTLTLSGVPTLA